MTSSFLYIKRRRVTGNVYVTMLVQTITNDSTGYSGTLLLEPVGGSNIAVRKGGLAGEAFYDRGSP